MKIRKGPAVFFMILSSSVIFSCSRRLKVPRIEWEDLPTLIVEKAPDLRTGYLIVPERRFPAKRTRTIRLPFIIMKSRSTSPDPDPVLTTAGGPGASTLSRARGRQRNVLLENRDVILLEQRGTRFSKPSLLAPEIDKALRSGWGTRLNGEPIPEVVEKALRQTLLEYESEGIDLAGYTTRESAADIADLRRLLAIQSWNLYGYSYSTKLMLTVLRDAPEGVRSVILDSVLPLEANWDENAPSNILSVLKQVLSTAREDDALIHIIDGIEEQLPRFLAEANLDPIAIEIKNPSKDTPLILHLSAQGIMNCIYAGLEDAGLIRRLPVILDALLQGDASVLAPMAETYLNSSQGYAWGMRLSVWCNEEFPFERIKRIIQPPGMPSEWNGFIQTAVPLEALSIWPQGRPDRRANEPVHSDIPALITAGEYDPDTPLHWSRATALHLSNAQIVEFAGMSHVPLFIHPDANQILAEFLSNPWQKVDPARTSIAPPFAHSLEEK